MPPKGMFATKGSRKTQPVYDDHVRLKGGWDQVSPTLDLPPGVFRDASNYECVPTGGYARIGGYERFDGHTKPSAATYGVLQVVSFTTVPAVGATLTGMTSGATGVILAIGSNYLILTQIVGAFTDTEAVQVGATPIGTAMAPALTITPLQNAQYTALAADAYRALISKPPGSGPTRGVAGLSIGANDFVYAFRDNAGGTATLLYVHSPTGWTLVPFFNEVVFTAGGAVPPADGAILTQGANTATIKRVVDASGSWAANTAAGRLVITTPAPGNFIAGAATIGGVTVTLSGVQTAITLAPGGKFEFDIANFYGQRGSRRLYGADGVNRCFEFDGTTLVPITTNIIPDTPKHIKEHKKQLFVSVKSSAFNSAIGNPFRWDSLDGGAEIATGDTITGFLVQPGEQTTAAMAIYASGTTYMLYGTSKDNWNLVTFNTNTGARDYSMQNMDQSYALDNRGIGNLATSQAYGNFEQNSLTAQIRPFILDKRSKVSCSTLARERNQYRLFFTDGTGLYLTIVNGKSKGSGRIDFPDAFYCAFNGEQVNGEEFTYVGGVNGFVYQLDQGSSFDGLAIDAYITLNWDAIKSPRVRKRMRKASIEMQGNFYAAISFGYQLGYGSATIAQPSPVPYESGFVGAPSWDLFVWDNFVWDGVTLLPTEVEMTGTAENVQIAMSSSTNYIFPYTLNSLIIHYTPRRRMR